MKKLILIMFFALAALMPPLPGQAQGQPTAVALAEKATMERDRARSQRLAPADRERAQTIFASAFSLWQAGKFDEAKLGFERGLVIDPANGPANYYLGDILLRSNYRAGAQDRFIRTKFFAPDSPEGLEADVALGKLSSPTAGSLPEQMPSTGSSFRDCADCPEMIVLPTGQSMMGTEQAETRLEELPQVAELVMKWERPRHLIEVRSTFAVGKYPIMQSDYARFVQATGYALSNSCIVDTFHTSNAPDKTKSWRDPGIAQTNRDPVVCVSWEDAKAYAVWLSKATGKRYRLLTEAEWEYAARAGTTTARYWGNAIGHANAQYDTQGTSPVGNYSPNAFGLYDMLGNVAEWTEDCWNNSYISAPSDSSIAWEKGACDNRVIRGGSWKNNPLPVRAGSRSPLSPMDRKNDIGFRVARAQ